MKPIYDTQDITVTLDDEAITISMYGITRLEMTQQEFEAIIQAYLCGHESNG